MTKRFTKYPSNYVGASIDSDIARYKKALERKASKKGLYENFGRAEVHKLEEKYRTLPDGDTDYRTAEHNRNSLKSFSDWCGTYTPNKSIGMSTDVKASSYDRTNQLSFDYIATGLTNNNIEQIIYSVFDSNGCEVNGIDWGSVDYSDVPEYKDYDVGQIGVAFSCDNYDGNAIITQLESALYDSGYEVIGYEFY